MSRSPTNHTQTTSSSSSTPSRASSFFAFRSKPSIGSSPPNKLQRASTANSPQQRSPPASQVQPQSMPIPPYPPPQPQQQPPLQQPQLSQQSNDQQPSTTNEASLHPEIRSIVSLTMAHTQKIYFSGPLNHKLERNPDGQRPHKDEGWREVWAQLYGTTLSIWDMGEVKIANQHGKEVPPSYVNITEAFVHVLGALTQHATEQSPPRKFANVITLNTAGTNLLLFSCPSTKDLISWAAAFRLSCWEKSRLEEIYTAHLMRITLNDGRSSPSTLVHGRLEGWVRVRIAGQTGWKKFWMCVSAGTMMNAARSSTDVASINSKSPHNSGNPSRPSSYVSPKRNRISGFFSRDKSSDLPERANICLYPAPRAKDKKKPLLTFDTLTQAFAVYPERPKLINSSTLIKLEGTYGNEDVCGNMRNREGWMLVMPDLEGARSVSGEMLKWLIAIHDAFELYGRPKMYSWDPRDPVSMMFAYPIGPEKHLLFLDGEAAEALDAREERTPVVRSKLLSIMIEHMRSSPGAIQNGNGIPQSLPVGQGQGQISDPPVSQISVLSFEQARRQQPRGDNRAQPQPQPPNPRALTPITERSTRDSNSWDTNANPPTIQRPGLPIVNGSTPQLDQIEKQESDASQDLPKLQTDAESSTFLGDGLAMSPISHVPTNGFGIGRADSPAEPSGSKPATHPSKQEPILLSRLDPKLDGHTSTDAVRPAGGPVSSPINSPGKESVFSALPSPYSNQLIHPVSSTFSDIPKTPPRSPDRPSPSFTPPIRKGPAAESGSPAPSSSSRIQGAVQRKEVSGALNSLVATIKPKTPEPPSLPQTDPYPNSPTLSPTPTTVNSPPTLTHTTTATSATSKSEYSGNSGNGKLSPPYHTRGAFSPKDQTSHSQSQLLGMVQGEVPQKETLPAYSGSPEGAKPTRQVNGGKEGSGDGHDLLKEAGALYYMQEIQSTAPVRPPRIIGRGENIPVSSSRQLDSDDEEIGEPSTQGTSQPPAPPEPSPLQLRRPSPQVTVPPQAPPKRSPQPSPHPPQHQHQDHGYTQARGEQSILAPQPQQPGMTSSFNPVPAMEGEVGSPTVDSRRTSVVSGDTNPASPVDSRRMSVYGSGGGSRPGLVSRPSGARDPVLKQRGPSGGTSDPVPSHSRHNGQPQPRHPLPPHSESSSEEPLQSLHSTRTQGVTTQQTAQAFDHPPVTMANVDQPQHYDDNSDALAALTFLERDEANAASKLAAPPSQGRSGPAPGPSARVYDTPPVHVTPSDNGDDVSQDSGSYEGKYRSSFAPSKQATQRLAKTQAQQAAHQAATHRPGKSGGANGKGKRQASRDGWAESSDEEEDEEEEDDEDVDSDGDPVAPRRSQGSGPGKNLGKLSAQGSPYGSTSDLNHPGQKRNLPRPPSPGRGHGDQDDHYHQQGPGGSALPAPRQASGSHARSQYLDDRRPSPQPHGHSHLRPQSDFPAPGAARQTIWSQALENKDLSKEGAPQRETFVQLEPSQTMTKAFAVHGLLSAGLQDRQERSAKRQEEVAKETGASLVNVPMKPPPPQTGLLGAVSAHERERQREGGIGAALTERERERRLAEERQRKLDDFQKQQLEMVQNGSMYGSQFPGFNPMMANPMMMNPMMGGWGFNPMMGNPQMLAAQQAAAQAYQQAMMTFAHSMGQNPPGGDNLNNMGNGMGMGGPGMLSPMMTGQPGLSPMMTGQFDPRMSMMGMPMMGMMGMGMGMGMGPLNPMMTGQSGMGPGMGVVGGGLGPGTTPGGGLATQMTGGSMFDPRLSPSQFDFGGGTNPPQAQGSPGLRPLDAPPPPRSPANASPGPR